MELQNQLKNVDLSLPTSKTKTLIGRQFGHLKPLGYVGVDLTHRRATWMVQCKCGAVKIVGANSLQGGKAKSCGCSKNAMITASKTTHGHASIQTSEYKAYLHAKARCENRNDKSFEQYGGRGIQFNFTSFEEFLNDVGLKPSPKHSLDRVNNEGNYEPGNLRWATRIEQARNKTVTRILTARGEAMTAPEWAAKLGRNLASLRSRLLYGWCDECTLFNPKRTACPHIKV